MVDRSMGFPFLYLCASIFFLTALGTAQAGGSPSGSAQSVRDATLRIRTYDWKGTLLREGRGFFNGPEGDIATIVTVLEGGYFVEAVTGDEVSYIVDRINPLSESSGLVFVRLEHVPDSFTFVDRAAPLPERGDQVWLPGGENGRGGGVRKAVIQETREVPGLASFLYIRASMPLGEAGSPVVNENGEVAGTVLLRQEGDEYTGILVSTERIGSSYGVSGEILPLLPWTEERERLWTEGGTGLYLKGLAQYWAGDYEVAVATLKKAAGENRYGSRKAWLVLGDCYRDQGEGSMAIDSYEKGLEKERALSDCHLSLMKLYIDHDRLEDARRTLQWAMKTCRDDSRLVVMEAWVLGATGRIDEALLTARKALGMEPAGPRAHSTLGELLAIKGLYRESIDALKQGAAAFPFSARIHYNLGHVYCLSGNRSAAAGEVETLGKLNRGLAERLALQVAQIPGDLTPERLEGPVK